MYAPWIDVDELLPAVGVPVILLSETEEGAINFHEGYLIGIDNSAPQFMARGGRSELPCVTGWVRHPHTTEVVQVS